MRIGNGTHSRYPYKSHICHLAIGDIHPSPTPDARLRSGGLPLPGHVQVITDHEPRGLGSGRPWRRGRAGGPRGVRSGSCCACRHARCMPRRRGCCGLVAAPAPLRLQNVHRDPVSACWLSPPRPTWVPEPATPEDDRPALPARKPPL